MKCKYCGRRGGEHALMLDPNGTGKRMAMWNGILTTRMGICQSCRDKR